MYVASVFGCRDSGYSASSASTSGSPYLLPPLLDATHWPSQLAAEIKGKPDNLSCMCCDLGRRSPGAALLLRLLLSFTILLLNVGLNLQQLLRVFQRLQIAVMQAAGRLIITAAASCGRHLQLCRWEVRCVMQRNVWLSPVVVNGGGARLALLQLSMLILLCVCSYYSAVVSSCSPGGSACCSCYWLQWCSLLCRGFLQPCISCSGRCTSTPSAGGRLWACARHGCCCRRFDRLACRVRSLVYLQKPTLHACNDSLTLRANAKPGTHTILG